MGIVPRGPDYGSTHEFPNNQGLGNLDFEHSDRLPVHEEFFEGGNISAGLNDTDAAETSGLESSSLREKVKAMAWIVPVVYTHFWIAAVISLLPPFFPPLASSRGVPAWKYGFVFSAVKLSMLPGSVLGEKLISKVSPRVGYLGGQASFSLFSILFGTLYWIKNGDALLAAAISCIAFGGCMYTTYTICLYCLLSNRFHEDGCLLIHSRRLPRQSERSKRPSSDRLGGFAMGFALRFRQLFPRFPIESGSGNASFYRKQAGSRVRAPRTPPQTM